MNSFNRKIRKPRRERRWRWRCLYRALLRI
jgi:hypothetical protein